MEKEQFLRFKEDLKKEAQEQRKMKQQRKTVRFDGERTINPYDAAEKVRDNKQILDRKYVVYYILKHQIEVTPESKEQVLWETYVKLHQKYKDARKELTLTNSKKQIVYYIDTSDGRDYTPENAMYDLLKMYDEIVKQYEK